MQANPVKCVYYIDIRIIWSVQRKMNSLRVELRLSDRRKCSPYKAKCSSYVFSPVFNLNVLRFRYFIQDHSLVRIRVTVNTDNWIHLLRPLPFQNRASIDHKAE